MEIKIKFKTNDSGVNFLYFNSYEVLGVWISNNYENDIVEIIVIED